MSRWRRFFMPRLTWRYGLRVAVVAGVTWGLGTHVLVPTRIQGISMEPTYHDGDLNLCWRQAFWFHEPRRGDVVVVRFSGTHMALIKRVVGLPGDTVSFRDGVLYVNGRPQAEPYVVKTGNWNLDPRRVDPDALYVVGDNRSIRMEDHMFGQADRERIIGSVLW